MKKVLITGAGGFIGSHLTELCLSKGLHVRALVRYNSMNDWRWLEAIKKSPRLEVVSGDIRDFDSVFKAMAGCDAVFHLAALIGIPYSYVSPLAYIRTNVEGSYNVLEAAKQRGLKQVIMTSTSETYGSAQYVPIDEKHPLVGQSPYSASKIAADQLAISYYRSFNVPVKIVRPFNTYGPRQSARAVIPAIMTQIMSGKKVIRLGNLSPTRDLTYVKDTVRAFLQIASCPALMGEVVNIGRGEEISIGDLAKKIAFVMGRKVRVVKDSSRVRGERTEVERLCCDNQKSKALTKWNPRVSLEQGLKETAAWIKNNLALYKAELYNV